eukprot:gnl/MRDRNA2_/MRDRNA2_95064_c0_seq1.p1 gnl/MRDRNA2_/MRDRNA2_95064_c0~~gnl/MRDRNA2_/MRDRNA2_95064_c0_seq1.p1  ORF type:complete len:362 (-),score=60.40 gnl/MRDRNA2_/MRDRNA2_95064_c0_seq1:82-1167(-)
MSAKMMCVNPDAEEASWDVSPTVRSFRPTGCGATVANSPTYHEKMIMEQFSPQPREVMPAMIEAVKANPTRAAKPFNSLKNEPKPSAGYPAAHSRGLMSSLLQQEAQVDMQQALQELADDLGSVEPTARQPRSTSDAAPEEAREASHSQNKKANHRSKSVSYLLTREDVVQAKKSASPKISKSDLMQTGAAAAGKQMITSSSPMKFRAAPEQEMPVLSASPEVFLHIYEVGELSPGVQKMLTTVLGRSALHVGVEIYGEEWSFGQSNAPNSMSGIRSSINPKTHACHRYKETMSLGRTSMNPDQVRSLIKAMDFMWLASEYHPLRRNCVNFAEELCHKLGVEQPPAYIGALSRSLKNFLLV